MPDTHVRGFTGHPVGKSRGSDALYHLPFITKLTSATLAVGATLSQAKRSKKTIPWRDWRIARGLGLLNSTRWRTKRARFADSLPASLAPTDRSWKTQWLVSVVSPPIIDQACPDTDPGPFPRAFCAGVFRDTSAPCDLGNAAVRSFAGLCGKLAS